MDPGHTLRCAPEFGGRAGEKSGLSWPFSLSPSSPSPWASPASLSLWLSQAGFFFLAADGVSCTERATGGEHGLSCPCVGVLGTGDLGSFFGGTQSRRKKLRK